MNPPLLPPQNLWLSLPALSPDEAEMILYLADELQRLLWEAYGDAITDNHHLATQLSRPSRGPAGPNL